MVPYSHPHVAEIKLAIRSRRWEPTRYPDSIHRQPTGHPVPMWQQRSSTATKKARKKKQKKNELAYELASNPERHEQQGGCRYRPRAHIIKLSKDAYFLTRNPFFSGKQPFSAFPKKIPYFNPFEEKKRRFWAGTKTIIPGWSMYDMKHKVRFVQACGQSFQLFSLDSLPGKQYSSSCCA